MSGTGSVGNRRGASEEVVPSDMDPAAGYLGCYHLTPCRHAGINYPFATKNLFGILMHHLEWKITSLMGKVLTATAGSAAEWLHMACRRAMTLGGSNKEWGHWAAANFVNAAWKTSSGFLDGSL